MKKPVIIRKQLIPVFPHIPKIAKNRDEGLLGSDNIGPPRRPVCTT